MLHLRLIVPVDLRDTVLGQLDRDFGVTHVIVLPGAAVRRWRSATATSRSSGARPCSRC